MVRFPGRSLLSVCPSSNNAAPLMACWNTLPSPRTLSRSAPATMHVSQPREATRDASACANGASSATVSGRLTATSDTPGAGWMRQSAGMSSPNVGPTPSSPEPLGLPTPVSSSSSAAVPGARIPSTARAPAPAMSTTPTATTSPAAMGTSPPPLTLSSAIVGSIEPDASTVHGRRDLVDGPAAIRCPKKNSENPGAFSRERYRV